MSRGIGGYPLHYDVDPGSPFTLFSIPYSVRAGGRDGGGGGVIPGP